MLQLLLLTTCFFIQISNHSVQYVHRRNARVQNMSEVDELKVSWNDSNRNLIHEKCH